MFVLEVARTPEAQARGYMWRKEISADEGMLFPGSEPAIRKFWMKNCEVAIDMLWLDEAGRVLAIEHAAPPCRSDPCPVYGPDFASRDVLEVRGGEARRENLRVGDRIEIHADSR